MKKIIFIFVIMVSLSFSEVRKATYEEIKNSIKLIDQAIKEEKEEIVQVLSEAIEIEKRATTSFYAEKIKKKVCETAKITEKEFDRLRRDFSFFDITISWAINQLTGKPIEKILKEKEKSNWIDIINETAIQKEVLGEKIKELNPKLKTS